MEIVAILRVLARHRLAVILGVVLAAVAGAATYKLSSKGHYTAVAWGDMILAEPSRPCCIESRKLRSQRRPHVELDRVPLTVMKPDGLHVSEVFQRPGEADCRILAAGKKHKRIIRRKRHV